MHQFSGLIFMYTTLLYLAFVLGENTSQQGNYMLRFDQIVILYLSYLLILLTDYV